MAEEKLSQDYSSLIQNYNQHPSGLTSREVSERQRQFGLNIIHKRSINILSLFIRQFTGNPLIIILATATTISLLLGQQTSSYYIFGIIIVSVVLGFWNEYSAERVVDNLLKKISPTALVIREGEKQEIPVAQLTIGDVVLLSQGNIIPADIVLVETRNLEINESALTGESKSVHKDIDTRDKANANIGFMGTSIESGSGKGIIIRIGKDTEFGRIAKSATYLKPTTEFQKGLAGFGQLIIKVILILTVGIFIINAFIGHSILESLLFALAIAVGLTPELLPVIVTVSLSHGAGKLAKKHVVAKRLISIENFGNMDILCTDKTGTLTEGKIEVVDYLDQEGKKNAAVFHLALLCNNAIVHHKVIGDSIDTALWEYALKNNISTEKDVKKLEDEPFDYDKKAMYTVIEEGGKQTFITKGAPETILEFCHEVKEAKKIKEDFLKLSSEGYRVVAIASKTIQKKDSYSWEDAKDLSFEGYITFLDIPKKTAKEALVRLHKLNVETKVITGDNEIIAKKICSEVGIDTGKIITGKEIDEISDENFKKTVQETSIFARVNPEQKLRIIKTLQSLGHTVGYMGDGINDIPSLHTADVGISVNTAIDVAKDAASVVLLRKSLNVIADGIIEGRKTFNNTMKYILMSTSSNFGNMFSAAGASFFLPFLPMTPVQILLTNGLYDISQMSIPSDNVDEESLVKPRHWNIDFIRSYMIFFGPLSSIFDFATFGLMIYLFKAKGPLFQTGWFLESMATEILVVFVIRTARTPFFFSKPSKWLLITCLTMEGIGTLLPFSPLAKHLGFVAPPLQYFFVLGGLVITYLILVEFVKSIFLKKYHL